MFSRKLKKIQLWNKKSTCFDNITYEGVLKELPMSINGWFTNGATLYVEKMHYLILLLKVLNMLFCKIKLKKIQLWKKKSIGFDNITKEGVLEELPMFVNGWFTKDATLYVKKSIT